MTGTCCYQWGIRKWDDGPIEIDRPIAYPNTQKGAAPANRLATQATLTHIHPLSSSSSSVFLFSVSRAATGQAPLQMRKHRDASRQARVAVFSAPSVISSCGG